MKNQNSTILKAWGITVGVLEIAYALEIVKGVRTISFYLLFSAICLAPLVGAIILYVKNIKPEIIKYVCAIGYGIFYTFMLFSGGNVLTCVYSLPILFVLVLTMDKKFIRFAGVGNVLINVIYIVSECITDTSSLKVNLTSYEIQIALSILCSVFAVLSVKTVYEEHSNQVLQIQKRESMLTKTLSGVNNLTEEVKAVVEVVTRACADIGTSSENTIVAMTEIVQGTAQTAELVEDQLRKTNNIQTIIQSTASGATDSLSYINKVNEETQVGSQIMVDLAENSVKLQAMSAKTEEQMNELKTTTESVSSIVSIITGIAGKTNLLALNASIEAARAGEFGKGFAVVANEIHSLSQQTKDATVSIDNLINGLQAVTADTISVVNSMAELNNLQDINTQHAAKIFEDISTSARLSKEITEDCKNQFNRLEDANSHIVDSIATVSAVSEEVTANTTQARETAANNADVVLNANKSINRLNDALNALVTILSEEKRERAN